MQTRAKIGLALVTTAAVVVIAGAALLYKDYIDLVYAESGRAWSPGVGIVVVPLTALALLGAGLLLLLTDKGSDGP